MSAGNAWYQPYTETYHYPADSHDYAPNYVVFQESPEFDFHWDHQVFYQKVLIHRTSWFYFLPTKIIDFINPFYNCLLGGFWVVFLNFDALGDLTFFTDPLTHFQSLIFLIIYYQLGLRWLTLFGYYPDSSSYFKELNGIR